LAIRTGDAVFAILVIKVTKWPRPEMLISDDEAAARRLTIARLTTRDGRLNDAQRCKVGVVNSVRGYSI
jgi:hypothetical protein